MNIDQLLDAIDDMLEEAWDFPLSRGKSLVNVEQFRSYIDDIRLNLPGEIKQAKMIVSDRAEIIATAKKEAEQIVRKAEERAKILTAQEEIVKQAQVKASEILGQSQSKAKEIKSVVQEFSDSMLQQSEEALVAALKEVKGTRQAMRQNYNKRP
ncbi:MAG: ATPase [Oscillospiraceae bacterium]